MGIGYFIFGNVDSRDYDIEVFFKDVDRTPKRVYKSIEVPGRNGAVLIDENRYEDVPFSYDCVALDDTYRKAFVNALASQIGYKRMQDSFNEGEFYSAVFDGDVDPNVTSDRTKSTFTVYFTRAAQRFLTSGEEAIDVDSGDTITNPTLFESSPMLEVEGYGAININDEVVSIQNEELGTIKISGSQGSGSSMSLDTTQLNNGDTIFYNSAPYAVVKVKAISGDLHITRNGAPINGSCSISKTSTTATTIFVFPSETTFSKGTNKTVTTTIPLRVSVNDTITNCTLTLTTSYTASTEKVTLSASWTSAPSTIKKTNDYIHNQYYGNSTKSILPSPMYIDLDIGEAYGVIDNEPLSFDNIVTLPAELPKLKSGANTITFDNTVTDLKVVPRYWKI